ncbi:hypothetical protein [Flavobacterium sp. LC2016-01]|uniref:hypothetical protein n=1 Tax=Flavobacterium sp. LC2016-01 TaxID=2675876 RepID=UPI0012BAECEA|nr:hypothetical protein [Flavobacterium sp. LC2016-01]MTH14130.1 hypothetical protein [Flavobacterium sp. LC2016-01]
MKLKNHRFFKKYRNLKYFLLVHLFFSLLVFISLLVHGIIDGNILETLTNPYKNYTALSNQKKYLKNDFFVLDTVYTKEQSQDRKTSPRPLYTIIQGNLLHSKIKQEIIYRGNILDTFYKGNLILIDDNLTYVYNQKKSKIIKVWRNTLNDDALLKNKKYLSDEKVNNFTIIYFQLSLIILIAILIILKKKSEVKNLKI